MSWSQGGGGSSTTGGSDGVVGGAGGAGGGGVGGTGDVGQGNCLGASKAVTSAVAVHLLAALSLYLFTNE